MLTHAFLIAALLLYYPCIGKEFIPKDEVKNGLGVEQVACGAFSSCLDNATPAKQQASLKPSLREIRNQL